MHREGLDFKLEVHLNQTVRPAVLKETSSPLLTIPAPFHTLYINKQYDCGQPRRSYCQGPPNIGQGLHLAIPG